MMTVKLSIDLHEVSSSQLDTMMTPTNTQQKSVLKRRGSLIRHTSKLTTDVSSSLWKKILESLPSRYQALPHKKHLETILKLLQEHQEGM
jgi:hypothetical protein